MKNSYTPSTTKDDWTLGPDGALVSVAIVTPPMPTEEERRIASALTAEWGRDTPTSIMTDMIADLLAAVRKAATNAERACCHAIVAKHGRPEITEELIARLLLGG